MWPLQNLRRIWQNTQQLQNQEKIYFTYAHFWSGGHKIVHHDSTTENLSKAFSLKTNYQLELSSELNLQEVNAQLHYLPPEENLADVDIVIITTSGSDQTQSLWQLRNQLKNSALILNWMIDNHQGHINNVRNTLVSDYNFPSHAYCRQYLFNPASIVFDFLPAAAYQWTIKESESLIKQYASWQRSNQLLINYVDYPLSWRSKVLSDIQKHMPEADVFLMPPEDRSRYGSKSKAEKFQEWVSYKTTLILPVEQDLSTRIFDSILAGQVPIIPEAVLDLDKAIPPETQQKLGIVRISNDFSMPSLRRAWQQAIQNFDQAGMSGVMYRQHYILNNHMLRHRVYSMLKTLLELLHRNVSPALTLLDNTMAVDLIKNA